MSRSVGGVNGSADSGRIVEVILSDDNITARDPHTPHPGRPPPATARVRARRVRRQGVRRRLDQVDRPARRRPPAADQLPLRLEGCAVGGRGRSPLRSARRRAGRPAPAATAAEDPIELGTAVAEGIRRFVRFAAAHPELNQIMVHEATEDSDRLRWMVERHVRPLYDAIRAAWQRLRDAGIAAPLDPAIAHYVIVGAASMPVRQRARGQAPHGGRAHRRRLGRDPRRRARRHVAPGARPSRRRSRVSTAVTRASLEVHRRATPARRHQLRGGGSGDEPDRDRRGLRRRPRGCAERPRPGVLRRPAALRDLRVAGVRRGHQRERDADGPDPLPVRPGRHRLGRHVLATGDRPAPRDATGASARDHSGTGAVHAAHRRADVHRLCVAWSWRRRADAGQDTSPPRRRAARRDVLQARGARARPPRARHEHDRGACGPAAPGRGRDRRHRPERRRVVPRVPAAHGARRRARRRWSCPSRH